MNKYKNLKDVFFDSKFHVGKGMAVYDETLDKHTFNKFKTFQEIVDSEVAMNAIVNSEVWMNAMFNSLTAKQAMFGKDIATQAIADSDFAKNWLKQNKGVEFFTSMNGQLLYKGKSLMLSHSNRWSPHHTSYKYSFIQKVGNVGSVGPFDYNKPKNKEFDNICMFQDLTIVLQAGTPTGGFYVPMDV